MVESVPFHITKKTNTAITVFIYKSKSYDRRDVTMSEC